jgi:hypothetical protein
MPDEQWEDTGEIDLVDVQWSRDKVVTLSWDTVGAQGRVKNVVAYGVYKPVARKARPVDTAMLESDKLLMKEPVDLLKDVPEVDLGAPHWKDLEPGVCMTPERMVVLAAELKDNLSDQEKDVLMGMLRANEMALAWVEEEKGGFAEEYIPALHIPTVKHWPWQDRMIRLPMHTRDMVLEYLRSKITAGLYE